MKFVNPENIISELQQFSPNIRITKGVFEFEVPGLLEDMEWNHMDQLHRPYIHNTYQRAIRIAVTKDFAVSLTQWQRIPLFITVTDVRVRPGLYYQCMTIAGLIYVHIHISMVEENQIVKSKLEWHITSHKWLKFLHKPLHKKLYNLNTRLQIEDSQIRKQRYALRQQGYQFASEPIDYLSSNTLRRNTIYPELPSEDSTFCLEDVSLDTKIIKTIGSVGFILKKTTEQYLIWPAACPHEGGDLSAAKECGINQLQCPWHGLRFSAVSLSETKPEAIGFGFRFCLKVNAIQVNKLNKPMTCAQEAEPLEIIK